MKHLKHAPEPERPMRPRRRRALDRQFQAKRESLDKLNSSYRPKPLFKNRASVNYLEYLHSPTWFAMRAKIFKSRGRRCESCGATKSSIQIHHLHYTTLGNERPKDVIILCFQCHEERHEL